ncbi:hypothetical protein AGRO_0716 [Agrobacterium sp. ATCC 31749]|nr:hypothetical protein AGRO_0716 [Agrobacterium sp. ATCC 31749]
MLVYVVAKNKAESLPIRKLRNELSQGEEKCCATRSLIL